MSTNMCACLRKRTTLMDVAIVVDEIMITNRAEATLFVPTRDDVHGDILPRAGSRAMDNDFCDFSHN